MLDINECSRQVVGVLAPFLPFLHTVETAALDSAGKKLGEALGGSVSQPAAAIWRRLFPALKENPHAMQAVEELAADPSDKELQGALAVKIRRILTEDEGLRAQLESLLPATNQNQISARAETYGTAVAGKIIKNNNINSNVTNFADARHSARRPGPRGGTHE